MANPLDLFLQRSTSDAALISQIEAGQVPSAPLSASAPEAKSVPVSTDFFERPVLSSALVGNFFLDVQTDLRRLFAASADSDGTVSALEKLGVSDLDKLTGQIDLLEERVQAVTDLQLGYDKGYTVYTRVNFIDNAVIETDPGVTGIEPACNYDPQLQALTLGVISYKDVLHTTQGTVVADPAIDLQLGLPVSAYDHLRTPAHAIDTSDVSYWGEVVLADEPVQLQWPPAGSPYAGAPVPTLKTGAVCEFTITFRNPTNWNALSIKPFCELPINLAGIFVVKRDPAIANPGETKLGADVATGYSRYCITEYNASTPRFLNQTARLFFPLQESCLSLTLVFHQPHYTREIFAVPADAQRTQALWQQMLGNTPLLGLPTGLSAASAPGLDLSATDTDSLINALAQAIGVSTVSGAQSFAKYQYVYGAYDIGVSDRRYTNESLFVSTASRSQLNLMQGTLIDDAELPLIASTAAAANSWFGDAPRTGLQVPAATLTYDLTFGDGEQWYPLAPLNSDTAVIHEPQILTTQSSTSQLRLQAKPGTPIYVTSFDGQGNVTTLGGVLAGPIAGDTPTLVTWPGAILAAPGYYVLSYTPIETSTWVNFGSIAEAITEVTVRSESFTGAQADPVRGLRLAAYPFINTNKIAPGFNPNGNPITGAYVPLTVSISNLPITFPNITDASGRAVTLNSFVQDTSAGTALRGTASANLETLFSSGGKAVDTTFYTAHSNWVISEQTPLSLFAVAADGSRTQIDQYDDAGTTVWTYDATRGIVRFLNGYSGNSGQIAISYSYYTYNQPLIINRTDYDGGTDPVLTPFDAALYPFIEYVSIDNRLFFNVNLPADAVINVEYGRLFDTTRVRASMTRVDPVNSSASPILYGYTLLARDANGTSLPVDERPEVVWADLEVASLGTTIQTNPGLSLVAGNVSPNSNLPETTEFHWYRIINAGSVQDQLRTNYDSSNGTTVFWDYNGDRYIESDADASELLKYQTMNVDGSNTIPVDPGSAVIIGICNYLLPPGTPGMIHPATIYSSHTPDYLKSADWLATAAEVSKETSIASVVIS